MTAATHPGAPLRGAPRPAAAGWDAVVVGSGPGGLTAAAYLAAAGKRVLVLEQHDLAGGNTQVFRRHHAGKEFEFDVGVHYLGDCEPGGIFPSLFGALGVGDRMRWNPFDRDGFDTIVMPELTLRTPPGWDAYTDSLVGALPDDADGIRECTRVLRAVADENRAAMLPGASTPTLDEWRGRSVADLFEHCALSPVAATALDYWTGLYAGAPRESTITMHAMLIDHYMRSGGWYPAGGGQMIAARLCQVIEALGGEVRTLQTVAEIVVDDGRVCGVRLAGGELVECPLVISNADYKRTVLELTDPSCWRDATLQRAREYEMTVGLVVVYVVVDTVLDGPNTNYFWMPSTDLDAYYRTLAEGRFPDEVFAYVSLASRKDPGNAHLCPPGHTNFQVMTLAPEGYHCWGADEGPAHGERYRRGERYRATKHDVTERLLDSAERLLGPFRDHIVHIETATPLTHERYTRSSGGTSYGLKHSPEQSGSRRPAYRTEVDGLWLVGANTVSGHGIGGAMVGGALCAGEILDRPVFVESMMGAQLVDPAAIPPDDADFDPVELCRGAALRARRAQDRSRRRAVSTAS